MNTRNLDLPDPPVAADVDLRSMRYMSIDMVRLFGSRFHAVANDSEWRAGMTLWLKSFHQRPAGSLPADDVELCRLAEFGRDIDGWHKVKGMAMHGWFLCNDNRYYHNTVASHVNEIATRQRSFAERARKATAARWGKNKVNNEPSTPDMFVDSVVSDVGPEKIVGDASDAVSDEVSPASDKRSRPASRPDGVSEGVWRDFLALRKAKRAPLTETALQLIRNEANKAGIPLDEVLGICCARGWQSFKAEWDWQGQAGKAVAAGQPREMRPRVIEPDFSKMNYGHGVQPL